jgi:hypothetical protein
MVNQALSVKQSRVHWLRWSFVAALVLAIGGAIYFLPLQSAQLCLRPDERELPALYSGLLDGNDPRHRALCLPRFDR